MKLSITPYPAQNDGFPVYDTRILIYNNRLDVTTENFNLFQLYEK